MKRHVSTVINPSEAAIAESPFKMLAFDNIYTILKYVDINGLFHFKRTCHYINSILEKKDTIQIEHEMDISKGIGYVQYKTLARIESHLNAIGLLDACNRFFNDIKAVIAGGFALMSTRNVHWEKFDIDIFVPTLYRRLDDGSKGPFDMADVHLISQALFYYFPMLTFINYDQSQYIRIMNENDDYDSENDVYANDNSANDNSAKKLKDNNIHVATCFHKVPEEYYLKYEHNVLVQFIFTDCDDVKNYINTNFDLSICKIYTDLNSIQCYNYDQLSNMESYVHIDPITFAMQERIEKYEKRGYKILRKDDRKSDCKSELQ